MPSSGRRVTITSSRTAATRQRRRAVAQEIDDETGVGDAFMRSLIRSQLRLALLVIGALAVVVCALPLLFAYAPAIRAADVVGIPLRWLVLGFLIYPVLIALGAFFIRHAERTEREFAELVERE